METATQRFRTSPGERLPGWMLGDWARWVRDPVDLMRLALLIGAAVTLLTGPREQSFRLLLTFLVVLIPRAIDAPRLFDFAFVSAMWLQAWGNVFGAFDQIYAYDKVVHTVLSGASAALLYLALVRLDVVPDLASDSLRRHRVGMVLLATALGWSFMGGLYEIYEWFADRFLGAHLYVSYGDSIGDLTVDGIGSLLGAVLILVWDRRGWGTRRRARLGGSARGDDPVEGFGEEVMAKVPKPGARRLDEPPALPGILGHKWNGALRGPLDLLRLSFGAGIVVALMDGNPDAAVRFGLTCVAVALVRELRPPRLFDLAFMAAMAMQAWGALAGQLEVLDPYEAATHVVVSLATAPILYVALIRLELVPSLASRYVHERVAIGLIAFSFGFSAGIVYELYLYVATHVLGASFGVDYGVLITQLGLDAAGALLGAALLVLWDGYGWAVRRREIREARLAGSGG
ncbi:MAG: hypothetical protein WB771_02140 [Solirubrobacterales bacterium]